MTISRETPPPTSAAASDLEELRAALGEANIPTLLLVLAQLTEDPSWLGERYRITKGRALDDNDTGGLSESLQAEVREAALHAIVSSEQSASWGRRLDPSEVADMLAFSLADEVPDSYGALLAEEIGQISRDVELPSPLRPGFSVLIIGAGIFGIGLAIKLKQADVPFTIIEKNADLGGVWLENIYPGAGVDTPSHLYSFSFEPDGGRWSRYFAKRPELHAYLADLAEEHDLLGHIKFGHEVVEADYDSRSATWSVVVKTDTGEEASLVTPVLVSAVGTLNRPQTPSVEGAESFEGPSMHTAEWSPDVDHVGKRVGVIGTGASAMQLVPTIAGQAEDVLIFQRSKQWVVPHPNYGRGVTPAIRYLMARCPAYTRWYRARAFWHFSDSLHASLQIDPDWDKPDVSINAQNERHRVFLTDYIKQQLGDREDLHGVCIPEYPPYGKRPLLDNGWYKALRRDDVHVITDPVARITPRGVATVSGEEHAVDILVWATGFKALQYLWPMTIRGASGRTLTDVWGHHDARAFLGMTVPDFPNLFILNGPNTNAGHGGSAVLVAEFQMRYVLQAIALLATGDVASVEVREDVYEDYNEELDAALAQTIWSHQGMTNWYRNEAGRVVVSSPWTYLEYWRRTRTFDAAHFVVAPATAGQLVADAGRSTPTGA
ncbi:flavin-containing monooxygenase [Aeromicrobium fastidiosum]|uniref:NAD(P)/FAD-dependent oxidoreductase n=1 Tax=Aeromicrobium fastidiosum TaxID=52699 RepID=A0A641ARP7_9ACTN|nr:NAD(P)/FAD-dependent oxidoreductase [Aeromicrobium fastidiosum]KAA1379883.1 NAD(P)/FAD-dependent oxidoreductase [Aeromicrobium fastidiosum]MBP2389387.1 4-hydroxyacetophenone monooxygenase [Aeromicrobium fastidiosum]